MIDLPAPEVLIIGGGPAGLFAARELAQNGCEVAVINRDRKPGGLGEFGVFYDKEKMKDGLRQQFKNLLATPNVHYFDGCEVCVDSPVNLQGLQQLGFDAILVCTGAQTSKYLDLPGNNLSGIYHANDVIFHLNGLPPFSEREYPFGKNVIIIGAGNVMTDIATYAIHQLKVDTVTVAVRRGPAAVKFDKKEFERVAANLDLPDLEDQFQRHQALLESVGQNIVDARQKFLECLPKAEPKTSDSRLRFRFFCEPSHFLGDDQGAVRQAVFHRNTLITLNEELIVKNTAELCTMDTDTVVTAIGSDVDAGLGLPVLKGEFSKNPLPLYPVEGISYEVYDPRLNKPLEGLFVAGWARKASEGVVGLARKDGTNGAKAVLKYLAEKRSEENTGEAADAASAKRAITALKNYLSSNGC